MSSVIEKLYNVSGSAICKFKPSARSRELSREKGLHQLLQRKNGFFCFERALHVFHSGEMIGSLHSIESWNSADGWRREYGSLLSDSDIFFAQDTFGGQFSMRWGEVWHFDPETADSNFIAATIEEWCSRILLDLRVLTGYHLAHEWQKRCGAMQAHQRLAPKLPFVLGGAFSVENLYAVDAAASMKSRAEIAQQITNLPDNSKVRLNTTRDD